MKCADLWDGARMAMGLGEKPGRGAFGAGILYHLYRVGLWWLCDPGALRRAIPLRLFRPEDIGSNC